jgi:mycoredoxin
MDDLYNPLPAQIVMYTTDLCPDCRRAKGFFEEHQISFLQVRIETDPRAVQFISEINHGHRSVPTIVFPDGSILVEPSPKELEAKFS